MVGASGAGEEATEAADQQYLGRQQQLLGPAMKWRRMTPAEGFCNIASARLSLPAASSTVRQAVRVVAREPMTATDARDLAVVLGCREDWLRHGSSEHTA
jgi:hypothetical protein